MEAVLIAVFAILFVVLLKVTGQTRQERLLNSLPGPRGYPIIGNFFDLIRQRMGSIWAEADSKFGSVYVTWMGSTPVVCISTPSVAEVVLSEETVARQPDRNSFVVKYLMGRWCGQIRNRNAIASALHSIPCSERFVEAAVGHCKIYLKRLNEKSTKREDLELLCLTDIVGDIAFGLNINSLMGNNLTFAESLFSLTSENHRCLLYPKIALRLTPRGREKIRHENIVKAFLTKIITQRMKLRSKKKLQRKSNILDHMLDMSSHSISDVQKELSFIIILSLELLYNMLHKSLRFLAHYVTIQEKLYQELENLNVDGVSTVEDLCRLTYLDRVTKETVRLCPPRQFILKDLERDIRFGSHVITRDSTVCVQIMNLHRDRASYPNKGIFDPDNFLPRTVERDRYAFIPFGRDNNCCIGRMLIETVHKVIITGLIRTYSVRAVEKPETDSTEDIIKTKIKFSPRYQT